MSLKKRVTQEEIDAAHKMKAQGLKVPVIRERLGRSLAAVYRMLTKKPSEAAVAPE